MDVAGTMEIRFARPADIRPVAALWCEAFPSRRTLAERIRLLEEGGRYGGLESVLVVERRGATIGAAKIYRLTEYLTGEPLPMMGLAAVAVDPAARRRGVGARLCTAAIRTAADRGDVVSVLYPFRPDYYERLGWGLVGGLAEHRFATDALPRDGAAAAVRSARRADVDAIAACYHAVARRAHGPIARDRGAWGYRLAGEELGVRPPPRVGARRRGTAPGKRLLVHDDGGVDGYALLRFRPHRDAARRTVTVSELVAATPHAYRGLLGHVAGLAAEWPRARHFARPAERFGDRLRDPRPPGFRPVRTLYFPTARVIRGPMLRILDLPGALARRRWFDGPGSARVRAAADTGAGTRSGESGRAGEAATFTVAATDEQRPGNTGSWVVRVGSDGRATVAAGDGRQDGATAGVVGSIAAIGRIWAGELTPSESAALGEVRVQGDAALLDAAFAVREGFWLLDEF